MVKKEVPNNKTNQLLLYYYHYQFESEREAF